MSLFKPPKFKNKSETDIDVSDTNISGEIDENPIREESTIDNQIKNEQKPTKNAKIQTKPKTIKRNKRNKIYAEKLSFESIELNMIKAYYALKIGSSTGVLRETMIKRISDLWNKEK